MNSTNIFKCVYVWKKLGRVIHTYVDSTRKKVFSVGLYFSGSSVAYKVASFNYTTNCFSGFIRGEFETFKHVSLCPKSNMLVGHDDSIIKFWNLQTKQEKQKIEVNTTGINSLSLSEDGQLLFVSFYENHICAWDLKTRDLVYELKGFFPQNYSFIISPARNIIVGRDRQNNSLLKAWNYKTGQELWVLNTFLESITAITFKQNSNILVIGGLDGKISFWDPSTSKKIDFLQVDGGIGTMDLSSDEKILILGYRCGSISILDLERKENTLIPNAHGRLRVEAISVIDKQHFVSAGWNGSARIWRRQ